MATLRAAATAGVGLLIHQNPDGKFQIGNLDSNKADTHKDAGKKTPAGPAPAGMG